MKEEGKMLEGRIGARVGLRQGTPWRWADSPKGPRHQAPGDNRGAPTLRIMWAAACQPRVPMCLLKEMLRWVADS